MWADIDWDDCTWACSCSPDTAQPVFDDGFWGVDTLVCSYCGTAFDVFTDGDTESGYYHCVEAISGPETQSA